MGYFNSTLGVFYNFFERNKQKQKQKQTMRRLSERKQVSEQD